MRLKYHAANSHPTASFLSQLTPRLIYPIQMYSLSASQRLIVLKVPAAAEAMVAVVAIVVAAVIVVVAITFDFILHLSSHSFHKGVRFFVSWTSCRVWGIGACMRNISGELRKSVRCRISAQGLCTFTRRTSPLRVYGHVAHTRTVPAPSGSKCRRLQSLLRRWE